MQKFHDMVTAHLQSELVIKEATGANLEPPVLTLSLEAKQHRVDYYNDLEATLAPGGEYESVRDVASTSAENAVRLAALFHLFEGGSTNDPIDLRCMEMGTECAA